MKRAAILLVSFALGCESSAGPDESLSATLDLDIRDSAKLAIDRTGDELDVSLELGKSFGVAPESGRLHGKGTLERFPEAGVVLYTARFAVAPQPDGPCGSQPISLALALHARKGVDRLSGSLTPYCGQDVWFGAPARSPLRLSSHPREE